jgi:hypothetical protein
LNFAPSEAQSASVAHVLEHAFAAVEHPPSVKTASPRQVRPPLQSAVVVQFVATAPFDDDADEVHAARSTRARKRIAGREPSCDRRDHTLRSTR